MANFISNKINKNKMGHEKFEPDKNYKFFIVEINRHILVVFSSFFLMMRFRQQSK